MDKRNALRQVRVSLQLCFLWWDIWSLKRSVTAVNSWRAPYLINMFMAIPSNINIEA